MIIWLGTKLYRQPKQAKLAGVCAGWAEFTQQDVGFVRFMVLIFIFFPLTTVPTMFTYMLLAMVLEVAPESAEDTVSISELVTELDLLERRVKLIENYVTSESFALQCKLWDN